MQFGERRPSRRGLGPNQVVAGREASTCVDAGHNHTKASTEPVAGDRVSDGSSDAVRHPCLRTRSSEVAHAQRPAPNRPAVPSKGIKVVPAGESANQAERRVRPF